MPVITYAASIGDSIDHVFFSFDTAVFSFFGKLQSPVMTVIAKLFTSLGDELFIVPLAIMALVLCFFKRSRKYGAALICAIAVGTLLTNIVFKPLVLRIRPYNTLQMTDFWSRFSKWYFAAGGLSESDYSFPSGHTTSAFEAAVAAFCCLRSKHKKVVWLLPFTACLVMCSRIYLMVHYPTDVIAGMVIGTFAGVSGYFLGLLITKVCEKIKFIDNIALEKLFKNGIKQKAVNIIICVALLAGAAYSFCVVLSEGADKVQTCAYNEEYDCMNEARVDDEKYPAIDGENYCKIHWKELSNNEEE